MKIIDGNIKDGGRCIFDLIRCHLSDRLIRDCDNDLGGFYTFQVRTFIVEELSGPSKDVQWPY